MTDAAVAEIEALEDRRWAAQIAQDTDALAGLLAEELTYTHSNALVDTKASYLDNIANRVFDYRSEKRTDTQIRLVGDTALVTGRAEFVVVAGERTHDLDARYTAVWIRHDGAWQFYCWQSTAIPA
jgi:ketosteroid isomerase-like protein